ncbi:hypothetical protein Hanom_Chr07g00615751 [Helianthus anomalus]
MAEPSNPLSTVVENPEPSLPTAAEEEAETLMTGIQMPEEYGATYPQEGDTAGDAPTGYVSMFLDWFGDCNLWLPLTVFVVEILEYYKLYISQLSPWFCQLTVQLGFFSFRQREGAPKLLSPPKGMTKWKTKFFYVKATTITAKLQVRNVKGTIIIENIIAPKAETVDWLLRLCIIGSKKLDNRQLCVLRMMIGRLDWKARPVLWDKNDVEAPLWRMFCPDFEGKIEIVRCGAGEEGWNRTIISNFRMPNEAALNALLPEGKGQLRALGDPATTGVPKVAVEKYGDKRQCKKKTHEAGLGVPGAFAGAGGLTAGAKLFDVRKWKGYAEVAGGEKATKFRKTRATAVPRPKPAVSAGKLIVCFASFIVAVDLIDAFAFVGLVEELVPMFAMPPSSPKVVDVEAQKKGGETPSIEVASKKTAGETISDTLDSTNNLIDPQDDGGQGVRSRSPLFLKKTFGSGATGKGVRDQPPIQPGEIELDYYYRSYTKERSFDFHAPLGIFCRGDNVMNDPFACRETLRGLGTPVETARARSLSRQNLHGQLASMLVGGSIIVNAVMEDYNALARKEEETIRLRVEAEAMVKAAREGAEQLEREKAALEKLKHTERWAASAGLDQVRTLAKLLYNERKLWKESYVRENKKLFREKAATEAAIKEAETRGATALKEAEAHSASELADADADRTKLSKVVEELQSRVTILEEVSSRATEAEARARQAEKVRGGLTTSLGQVTMDHASMREHGIGQIVETILDAPENAIAVAKMNERARQAGFKAGYNKCLSDVKPFFTSKFTDERSGFHGVDTEGAYDVVVDAYNKLSILALDDIEKCLAAEDYVDRLRMLFEPSEEDEGARGAKDDEGTSGAKAD